MGGITAYVVVAAAVFGLNLLPAFGPPTWAVLVLFSLHHDFWTPALVVVGALSAAAGRLLLAQATRALGDRLPERPRANLRAAGELIATRGRRSIALLVLFLLSPLPSAQLFEAAGLMTVRLLPLAAAFVAGRLVSYATYVGGAGALSSTDTGKVLLSSLTSPWGVVLQVLMLLGLVLLARVDWSRLRRHE
jgi:uncharacterized membrane protein YdjX (TVP38/TMEM64 family)